MNKFGTRDWQLGMRFILLETTLKGKEMQIKSKVITIDTTCCGPEHLHLNDESIISETQAKGKETFLGYTCNKCTDSFFMVDK